MTQDVLTGDNFASILSWIAGSEGKEPDFTGSFISELARAANDRRRAERERRRGRPSSAAAKLSLEAFLEDAGETPAPPPEPAVRADPAPAEEKVAEAPVRGPLDSVTLGRAVIHLWTNLEWEFHRHHGLSGTYVQTVLYMVYGTWLAERGERLLEEHPQMWKYGPVFPRAYSHLKAEFTGGHDSALNERAYRSVTADPVLKEFLDRTVRTTAGRKISDLARTHVSKGSAWGRCLRENPGRWSTAIDDDAVRDEFRRRLERRRNRT